MWSTSSGHLYTSSNYHISCLKGVSAVYPSYIIYGRCISVSILSMEGVSVFLYYLWKVYQCIYIIYGRCINVSILSMEGVSVYLYYLWKVYQCIYIIYGRCISVFILSMEGVSVYLYYLCKVYQCILTTDPKPIFALGSRRIHGGGGYGWWKPHPKMEERRGGDEFQLIGLHQIVCLLLENVC